MKQLVEKMINPINTKLGLLILRITLGGIFLSHGIGKLSNMEQTVAFFGTIGFSAFLAWFVALVETIGGAAVILGIGTRMAASLLAIIMVVSIICVKGKMGFAKAEIDIVLLGLSLGVALLGCGKYSLCSICHKKECSTCTTSSNSCGCDCAVK